MQFQNVTRRQLLQTAASAGVAVALTDCSADPQARNTIASASTTSCLSLDLTGNTWTMHEEGTSERIPAIVPGATYTDLARAKKIPDPYYRENNGRGARGGSNVWTFEWDKYIAEVDPQPIQWVAEKNWIYHRTFNISNQMLAKPHVVLRCHGLDTLASLWINGAWIGDTDNMFREWEFDIKLHLKAGSNDVRIRFGALTHSPYVEKKRAAYLKAYDIDLSNPRSWIRKGPYMWGWDWCRPLLTQGIWKPIEIVAYDAKITDLGVIQHHQDSGAVQLDIQTTVDGAGDGASINSRVLLDNKVVATASAPVTHGVARCTIKIDHPQLWWPNGMGDHPLYTVESHLHQSTGGVVGMLSFTSRSQWRDGCGSGEPAGQFRFAGYPSTFDPGPDKRCWQT